MRTLEAVQNVQARQRWTDSIALRVVCEYIDNQKDESAFLEFLARQEEDEEVGEYLASTAQEEVVDIPDHRYILNCVRHRLLDFDDEDLEIELLYMLNEAIDGDPFSVRLTEEMWEEYKRG